MTDSPNCILTGDALVLLKQMPSESVDLIITSPPYWGLRFYGEQTKTVWGGKADCNHKFETAPTHVTPYNNEFSGRPMATELREQTPEITVIRRPPGGGYDPDSVVGNNANVKRVETFSEVCNECGAWFGQLGLEPHYQMYVNNLLEVFTEAKRVLKKTGSFYLNIGDCYNSTGAHTGPKSMGKNFLSQKMDDSSENEALHALWFGKNARNLPPKTLLGMPWRVVFAMIDDGWTLRNDVIWFKPNHMPASVKDRYATGYEHIFFFTKSKRYYFNLDAIRIPHQTAPDKQRSGAYLTGKPYHPLVPKDYDGKYASGNINPETVGGPRARRTRYIPIPEHKRASSDVTATISGGGNRNDLHAEKVWSVDQLHPHPKNMHEISIEEIKRQPKFHTLDHSPISGGGHMNFANPSIEDIKERIGDAHSGEATANLYRPHSDYHPLGKNPGDMWAINTRPFPGSHFAIFPLDICYRPIIASCPPDGVVLDPFAGSGTVAEAVEILNRCHGIPSHRQERAIRDSARTSPLGAFTSTREWVMIELSPEYVEIMKKRLSPYGVF